MHTCISDTCASCLHAYLHTCLLFLTTAAATAEGTARVLRQYHLNVIVWSWNYMNRYQLTDALRCGSTCIGGSFHGTHIAAHHHGHETTANIFTANERHVCGFDHRIGGFNRADETFRLDHSK